MNRKVFKPFDQEGPGAAALHQRALDLLAWNPTNEPQQ